MLMIQTLHSSSKPHGVAIDQVLFRNLYTAAAHTHTAHPGKKGNSTINSRSLQRANRSVTLGVLARRGASGDYSKVCAGFVLSP